MQSIAFEDMDTIHKKRVTSNVFETRTSTWEELKKTSDDALFHLKYLLQVYSETDGTNFSSDDLQYLKELAGDYIKLKQDASFYLEANKSCERASVTVSGRREKSSSQPRDLLTIYEQAVANSQKDASLETNQELRKLFEMIEVLQEGEVVSSVFPVDEKHFTCPISQKLFVEPVRNKECLHTYSKAALLEYLKSHQNSKKTTCVPCPVAFCDKSVSLRSIEPNHEMERLLKEWSSHQEQPTKNLEAVAVEEFTSTS